MKQIYLDNASTTRIDEGVLKKMIPYLKNKYGNASANNKKGYEVKKAIEESRKIIADSINAQAEEIYFTSGGTESNNLALKGLFFENYPKKNHIITTKIEHASIFETCKWLEKKGAIITYLEADNKGFVDLNQLEKSITEKTIVVSIIHGNNEIGTIQNLEKIGKICSEKNTLFHLDACQSYMKTKINVKQQNIDLLTLNSHKIHGPKGVGALFIKKSVSIIPLLHGGYHEKNMRSGTENIPGIIGFAEAVKIHKKIDVEYMRNLKNKIIGGLVKINNVELNGCFKENSLPNIINISFNNIEGESIAQYLNEKNIYVSTGSACSSKNLEPSHVLLALGKNPLKANSSIRISISKNTTEQEIDIFLNEIKLIINRLRKISPLN